MNQRPTIAVISPNVLTGIGLKSILEKVIPMADVECYADFAAFEDATPDRFFHCFVAAPVFLQHAAFFRRLHYKTFILCNGTPQAAYADMSCLDVSTSEEGLVHALLQLHEGEHHHLHPLPKPATSPAQLTDREAEVLRLLAQGLINKEIADRLHIGLTTVISHRKNIGEKLGIHSVAELAIYAVQAGYADEKTL